jgi:hypothetical protein
MDEEGTYFPITTFRLCNCPHETDTFFFIESDACSQNPEACSLLLESLESELAVVAGVADMDLSAGGDSPDIEVVK